MYKNIPDTSNFLGSQGCSKVASGQPFFKTHAVFNPNVRTVVWNDPVSVLFVQRYGLRLFFASFQNASFIGQFLGPNFQCRQDAGGNALSPPLGGSVHSLYFHNTWLVSLECPATYGLVIFVGNHGVFDLINFIVLVVKRMILTVPNRQVGIQMFYKSYKISMRGICTNYFYPFLRHKIKLVLGGLFRKGLKIDQPFLHLFFEHSWKKKGHRLRDKSPEGGILNFRFVPGL